ncbi:MAG: histidine phosphatase family protein [Actinomycetota bacterium]|nr:histidine phosphatase family protein [Actinomycetota bacterium]
MSAPPATRLLLVRHGEAEVAVRRIVGGERSCTGLSELGRAQAQRLAERFAAGHEPPVDVLYASTLPRARETAEALAPVLGLDVLVESELVELRPGEADGLGWDEVTERFAPDPDRDPFTPLAPGAESRAVFHQRALTALMELARRHDGATIVVACHGGVVDAALRYVLGLGLLAPLEVWTRNCSITEVALGGPAGERRRWRLVRYNDFAHLGGLPHATER